MSLFIRDSDGLTLEHEVRRRIGADTYAGPISLRANVTEAPLVPEDPTPSAFDLAEQFDGTYNLTASNNGTHPWIRCEPGDKAVDISNGRARIDSLGSTGARQISARRFGDVGQFIRLTTTARVTALSSEHEVNGTIPAFCLGIKYRCPSSQFPEDDWESVRGYNNDGSPGSFIFRTGIGAQGRLQLPRNKACTTGYESGMHTRDIGYTLGEWVSRTILLEHLGATSSDTTFRVRYWTNDTQSGAAIFDHTVTHPTITVKPAYLWMRTDQCVAEVSDLTVETGPVGA